MCRPGKGQVLQSAERVLQQRKECSRLEDGMLQAGGRMFEVPWLRKTLVIPGSKRPVDQREDRSWGVGR